MEPGQQDFVDLSFTQDGALIEETGRVSQFGLTLVRAEGVGPTGGCGLARAVVPAVSGMRRPKSCPSD